MGQIITIRVIIVQDFTLSSPSAKSNAKIVPIWWINSPCNRQNAGSVQKISHHVHDSATGTDKGFEKNLAQFEE